MNGYRRDGDTRLNAGNPDWTPYEIPELYREGNADPA